MYNRLMQWLEHAVWLQKTMGTPVRQLYLDLPGTAPLVPSARRRRPSGIRRIGRELSSFALPTPEKAKEQRLRMLLQSHLRRPVHLIITDNVTNMVHISEQDDSFQIRLHRMFLEADGRMVWTLARFIETGDGIYRARLSEFIEEYSYLIKHKAPDPDPRGEVHDLQEIFDSLNERYFGGRVRATITWGQRPSSKPRHHKSVKLGTYNARTRTITIHPLLDRSFVPRFFVEFVVYHEMVHAVVGGEKRGDRVYHHTGEFRELERRFDRYLEAVGWEKDNRVRLLYF